MDRQQQVGLLHRQEEPLRLLRIQHLAELLRRQPTRETTR